MTWTFRNRIELQPHCRLQYPGPEWVLEDSGSGRHVKLTGRSRVDVPVLQIIQQGIDAIPPASETPIQNSTILVLSGTGYESENDALSYGELWRGRLMRAFVTLNIAAVFDERPGAGFTSYGLASIGRGTRVLNDSLKLWAYEENAQEPRFIAANPVSEFWITSPHERLASALVDAVEHGALTRELQVSYSLYSSSFGGAPEARFAMLMIAFESLLKVKPRSSNVQEHVRSMRSATANSGLPASEIASINGALKWLLNQSIGQSGRELASSLGLRDYLPEAPDKFFTNCYTVRSRLVHGNHPIPSADELGILAAPLERMVAELIVRASLVDEDHSEDQPDRQTSD